jgi:uncharacterized protein with HEPN domain
MSRSPKDYLQHILQETAFILERSQGLTQEAFFKDELLKRAYVRSLEIIGEASKNLPDEFRQRNPQVPWRRMSGMWDRLIHVYFGVDYEVVWDVIVNQIPGLHQEVERLINEPQSQ